MGLSSQQFSSILLSDCPGKNLVYQEEHGTDLECNCKSHTNFKHASWFVNILCSDLIVPMLGVKKKLFAS